MHIIAEEIRDCKKGCFVNLYQDIEYKNRKWLKNEIDCIKPLVYGAEKPNNFMFYKVSDKIPLNRIQSNKPFYVSI